MPAALRPASLLPVASLTLMLGACDRQPSPAAAPGGAAPAASAALPAAAAAAPASPGAASGSPLARLVPRPAPATRAPCPLAIEPGVSLGPVALGETVADLTRAGLEVKQTSPGWADVTVAGSKPGESVTLHLELCEGKIIDILLADLRHAPACVSLGGQDLAPATPREEVARRLGGCVTRPPMEGGVLESCAQGGVLLGHGLGDFVQIRVRPRGFEEQDACAHASDDGSPVALSAAERTRLLSLALDHRALGPHWHVDRPGRDPLRIVRTPLVPASELRMFGSPVAWIEPSAAGPGTAFVTVSRLEATRTRATLVLEYPVEGVTGTFTFRRPRATWELDRGEARER